MNMLPRHDTIREALRAASREVDNAHRQMLRGEIDEHELQEAIARQERIMAILRDVMVG